jgi:shikimate dehydrogenase
LAVNATSLGLHAGDALPFDPSHLPEGAAVFDIIAARDTELMVACAARGLAMIGGRPMIEHQIAAQIAFWRGTEPLLESRT